MAMLQRWDPFAEMRRVEDTMNRLWRGLGRDPRAEEGIESWHLPVDVLETDDELVIKASLPGLKPDGIEVSVEEGVLTIQAETKSEREEEGSNYLMRERRVGRFHRSLRLPESVESAKASSSYEHGVLAVTLPKREEAEAKRIEIKVE